MQRLCSPVPGPMHAIVQDPQAELDTLGQDGDAPLADIAASMGITLEQLLGVAPSAGHSGAGPSVGGPSSAGAGSAAITQASTAADASEPPTKRARRSSAGYTSHAAAEPGRDAIHAAAGVSVACAGDAGPSEGGKRTRARRSALIEVGTEAVAAVVVKEEEAEWGPMEGVEGAAAGAAAAMEDGRAGCLKREVKDLLAQQEKEVELKREMQRRLDEDKGDGGSEQTGMVRMLDQLACCCDGERTIRHAPAAPADPPAAFLLPPLFFIAVWVRTVPRTVMGLLAAGSTCRGLDPLLAPNNSADASACHDACCHNGMHAQSVQSDTFANGGRGVAISGLFVGPLTRQHAGTGRVVERVRRSDVGRRGV